MGEGGGEGRLGHEWGVARRGGGTEVTRGEGGLSPVIKIRADAGSINLGLAKAPVHTSTQPHEPLMRQQ